MPRMNQSINQCNAQDRHSVTQRCTHQLDIPPFGHQFVLITFTLHYTRTVRYSSTYRLKHTPDQPDRTRPDQRTSPLGDPTEVYSYSYTHPHPIPWHPPPPRPSSLAPPPPCLPPTAEEKRSSRRRSTTPKRLQAFLYPTVARRGRARRPIVIAAFDFSRPCLHPSGP